MNLRSVPALALFIVVQGALAAGPVQTITRAPNPSASEELVSRRGYIPAADARSGLLFTPAPYPDNRVDSVHRLENGRPWVSRWPVSSRTPLRESVYGFPGPAAYGADSAGVADVIFIQPDVAGLPPIAVSPWTDLNSTTADQIERVMPNVGRFPTFLRSDKIVRDLRRGQHQWLRENGYIQKVRTHTNPMHVYKPAAQSSGLPEPSAIIRVIPDEPQQVSAPAEATVTPVKAKKPKPAPVVRVRHADEPVESPAAQGAGQRAEAQGTERAES